MEVLLNAATMNPFCFACFFKFCNAGHISFAIAFRRAGQSALSRRRGWRRRTPPMSNSSTLGGGDGMIDDQ
ncbi:hypothetical protein KCV06_g207, partial [Aureobasidium melanogenum]